MSKTEDFRCGYIAIVGRPNVGKSTLLNALLGQKLSITSPKPQTTRHQILGIRTDSDTQYIFVDTPGMHKSGGKALNRYMDKAAGSSVADVDAVIFVVAADRWTDEDEYVLQRVRQSGNPVILAVNKVDKIEDKEQLLPLLAELSQKMDFAHILPVSAWKKTNLTELLGVVRQALPQAEAFYPEDQITNRSERFLAAEIIREKLMRKLGKELPYSLTVEIEKFALDGKMYRIGALIWVERQGQKKIVIGRGGEGLRDVGAQARKDMENLFGRKVFLELWVKVREGWSDDERALRSLGYDNEQ